MGPGHLLRGEENGNRQFMQIASSFCGVGEGVCDRLLVLDQETPDWLTKITFPEVVCYRMAPENHFR